MAGLVHLHDTPLFEDLRFSPDDVRLRTITTRDLWDCLRKGYDDFSAKPGSALALLAIYHPLAALILTLFAFDQESR